MGEAGVEPRRGADHRAGDQLGRANRRAGREPRERPAGGAQQLMVAAMTGGRDSATAQLTTTSEGGGSHVPQPHASKSGEVLTVAR